MRSRLLAIALLGLPGLAACNAPRTAELSVDSVPPGATILVDGTPIGKTPAKLELDVTDPNRPARRIRVELEDFDPAEGIATCVSDLEIMTPRQACGRVLCAPCCLGLPLLGFLEPMKRVKRFDPPALKFDLKRSGEGVAINAYPAAVLVVDGVIRGQVTAATTPLQYREYLDKARAALDAIEQKTVLITEPGARKHYEAVLRQTRQAYTDCENHFHMFGGPQQSKLRTLEDGLDELRSTVYDYMRILSDPKPFRPLYDQVLSEITCTRLTREISRHFFRLPVGPHLIELQAEGYQPWTNQVQISAGEYLNLDVQLHLETSSLSIPSVPGFGPETLIYDGEHLLGQLKGTSDATEFPLSPGHHTLRARQGRLELIEDLEIKEHQKHLLDLEALAHAKGPWLGATLAVEDGEVRVTRVVPGGPAQKAGLQVGDRLLALDAESLKGASLEVLERLVLSRAVGDTMALEVGRGDPAAPSLTLSLTLARRNP